MSAITTTNFPLKIQNDQLQIGDMKIPIGTARICWVASEDTLQVVCQCAKGGFYEAGITLQLQSIEKTKECFRMLATQTQTHVSSPNINELKPDVGSVAFIFNNEKDAEQFQVFYAPSFFPEEEFQYKLDGKRCDVISLKNDDDSFQIQRINEILKNLENRIYGHEIDGLLYKNGNAQFPGKMHPKEFDVAVPFDFEGNRSRSFIVCTDQIFRIKWNYEHQRSEVLTTCTEIEEWINERGFEQVLEDKKCWENFYEELNALHQTSFAPYILSIREMLDNFDTIKSIEQQIASLFEAMDKDTVLRTTFLKCFK